MVNIECYECKCVKHEDDIILKYTEYRVNLSSDHLPYRKKCYQDIIEQEEKQ